MSGPRPVRPFRPTAFRLGLIAGLATSVAGLAIILAWPRSPAPPSPVNVVISSSGADLSRRAARRMVVSNTHGRLVQDCRDVCDDLTVTVATGENAFRVQVSGGPDGPALLDGGAAVQAGDKGTLQVRVAGADALKITTRSDLSSAATRTVSP